MDKRMKKMLFLLLLLMVTPALGGYNANIGVVSVFGNLAIDTPAGNIDSLGLSKSQNFYEIYGLLVNRSIVVRASYLFPKSITGSGETLDPHPAKDTKPVMIPIASDLSLGMTRLEIGKPMNINGMIFEPFIVGQQVNGHMYIKGATCDFKQEFGDFHVGLGGAVTQVLTKNSLVAIRGYVVNSSSQIEVKALGFERDLFWGIGWRQNQFKFGEVSVKMNGPFAEFGLMF
jgi:hypothetical protein